MKKEFKYLFLPFFAATLFFGTPAAHTKDMDVDVTGSVLTAYDSNITYASTNLLSDFVTNLETGLVVNQQSETHQLSLKTDVIEQIYADHSNLDNTSEDLNFTLKQDLSKYDRVAVVDILTHSYQPTSFEDAFGRTTGFYSTFANQTALSYTHDFSEELSGEVHYGNTVNAYSQSGPVNSVLNQGGTTVTYTHDSANIFNASYDYIRDIFEPGPGATINSLLTGVKHYFTSQLYANLGVGPDFIKNFNGKNDIEPHYKAALTDQVDQNNSVSLTYEDQDTTSAYTEDLFNSWRTTLNLNRQFSSRLSGSASIFYGQGSYKTLNVNESFTGVQTQINYGLTKKTNLALGYSYTDSTSKNSGFAYLRNYVFFSFTIKF